MPHEETMAFLTQIQKHSVNVNTLLMLVDNSIRRAARTGQTFISIEMLEMIKLLVETQKSTIVTMAESMVSSDEHIDKMMEMIKEMTK